MAEDEKKNKLEEVLYEQGSDFAKQGVPLEQIWDVLAYQDDFQEGYNDTIKKIEEKEKSED